MKTIRQAAAAMALAVAVAVGAGTAQAQTTTYTWGTSGSADGWNQPTYWDTGVPSGAINAAIPNKASEFVVIVNNAATPTYSGNLSIGSNVTLQIGSAARIAASDNAYGTPGSTVITMGSNARIDVRNGGVPSIPAIQMTGNASYCMSSSTQPNSTPTFGYGINGAYTFKLQGKSGCSATLTAANNFGTLLADPQYGTAWTINANAAGSLGGDVRIKANPATGAVGASLIINNANAMSDTATLSLGGTAGALITMNQSDTVGRLFINGVQQPAGSYTSASGWISGTGTLTVNGPTAAYWDLNGATAGAGGAFAAGTWDAANTYWNAVSDGTGATAAWSAGNLAVFGAGTDAGGVYTVTVSGTPDIAGLSFEEGAVTLSGGGLRMTADSLIWVAPLLTGTIATPISNDAARQLSKGGAGTLVLSGANTYSGVTAVGDGILSVSVLANAGSNSNLGNYPTAGAGGLILGGGTLRYTGGSASIDRGFTIMGNSTIDVATPGATLTLGACEAVDAGGQLTVTGAAGSSLAIGQLTIVEGTAPFLNPTTISMSVASVRGYTSYPGTSVLNLGGTSTANVVTGNLTVQNPPGSPYTRTLAMNKYGAGSWRLAGTISDNSGNSAIYDGTLTLAGQDGNHNQTTLAGGTLVLDYTSNVNRKLGNSKALQFKGGTLTLHNGTYTEVASATTLGTAGAASLTRSGSSTGKVRLNAITRQVGATIDFADASIADTDTVGYKGILGGYATLGNDWARNSTGASDGPITALASYTGPLPTTGGTTNDNDVLTGSQTQTGAVLANTVKIVGSGSGDTLALGANNLTIAYASATYLGGILYVGGGDDNYNITGSGGRILTTSTTGELIINVKTGTLTISTPFVTSGGTAGILTKTGAGTLIVNAANGFTGAVYHNQGVLRLMNATATGTTVGGIQVQPGAALELANNITVGAEAINPLRGTGISSAGALRNLAGNTSTYQGAITLGVGGARINSDSGGTLTISSNITTALNQDLTVGGAGNTTISGVISGAGSLVKDGAGALTLSGNNTYTGLTDVREGTLTLNRSGGTIANSAPVSVSGGTLNVAQADTVGAVTLAGGTISGAAALTGSCYALTGSGAISAVLAGSAGLANSGSGTNILTGVNTYTGATMVNAGTLLVNSPGSLHASSAVFVNGGTLGGDGAINGSVTVGADGSLAPGASAGTLAIGGGLDVSALAAGTGTGKLKFDLDAQANPKDLIAVTGSLTIGSGLLGFSDFDFTDLGGLHAGTYKLITTTGGISGTLDAGDLVGVIGSLGGTLQINGNDLELVIASGDIIPPAIVSLSPTNNATNVSYAASLTATFDELVQLINGGVITITNLTDATATTITIPDGQVTIVGGTNLTIAPSAHLDFGKTYAVRMDGDTVEDLSGNNFGGIADTTTWRFTTAPRPALIALSPTNNATEVPPTANLEASFDKNIVLVNGGVITITNLTDATATTITLPDSQVSAAGAVLTIDLAANLQNSVTYAVLIDGNAVEDTNGNPFAGISDTTTWRFTTMSTDLTPPALLSLSPTNNAADVPITNNLAATFDESVALISGGAIVLTNLTEGTAVVMTIPDAQLSVVGPVLWINPTANLEFGDTYAVLIASNTVKDLSDNVFGGIGDDTTWRFSAELEPAIVALDPTNDAGGVEPDANLSATFNKEIVLVDGGVITVTNLTDGTATNITLPNAQVSAAGAVLTINPAQDLRVNRHYAVRISATAIRDLNGNYFAGIADTATWNFTIREAVTTTYTGPNTSNNDTWNKPANWDHGVPSGQMNVVIPSGKLATAWTNNMPTYTGNLTISNNATVGIGWTTVYLQSYNALGTPGMTTIFMCEGAFINMRMGGTPQIPAIQLLGNATICLGSSTQPGASPTFGYAIQGPYTLTLKGGGTGTKYYYLTASNSFAHLVADPQFGTNWNIHANAAGALGSGDVTIEQLSGNAAALLTINAANAMADSGTLSLNGSNATLLTMNANDTIAKLYVNGVQQSYGTYGRVGLGGVDYNVSWISGNGILTVPPPPTGYWDLNGAAAGAGGPTPAGTWNATNEYWNNVAAGTGAASAWTPGQPAVFAAGTDATGAYTVTVEGTQDIGGLSVEEGTVTLSGGELRLTAESAVTVATGLTAEVASTLSDDGTAWLLSKGGAGTLALSGANSYTGVTKLEAGVLSVASLADAGTASPLGAYPTAGAGGLVLAGGTLRYMGGSASVNRGLTVSGNSTLDVSGAGTAITLGACASADNPGTLTVNGGAGASLAVGEVTIIEGASLTLNPSAIGMTVASVKGYTSYQNYSYLTLSGTTTGNVITGNLYQQNPPASDYLQSLHVTKTGSGTWTLSSGSSSYSGQLTVQSGTLSVPTVNNASANGPLGNSANAVILGGTGGQRGTLQYTGGTASSNKKFTMAAGGTGVFQIDNAGAVLTLSAANDGTGAMVKTGPGTLALSGANTYSGGTTVSNGTLRVNGSLAAGAVSVNTGSALEGSGTITGAVAVASGATLTPGAGSVGTLTLAGGLTLNSGATLPMQLGTSSDLVRVSGGTISGPATGTVAINVTNAGGLAKGDYTLIDWTGATPSSLDAADFAVTMPSGWVGRVYIENSKIMLAVRDAVSVIQFR